MFVAHMIAQIHVQCRVTKKIFFLVILYSISVSANSVDNEVLMRMYEKLEMIRLQMQQLTEENQQLNNKISNLQEQQDRLYQDLANKVNELQINLKKNNISFIDPLIQKNTNKNSLEKKDIKNTLSNDNSNTRVPQTSLRAMQVAIASENELLESDLQTLATIASVSPYIGLLGTVWGIMNSFQSLSQTSQTTIATVAPGISEALIATALGLITIINYN